jgi:hypothetical protein
MEEFISMLTIEADKEISEAAEDKEGVHVSVRLRSIYNSFSELSVSELEDAILLASDRDEKILYRTLLNLKMQLDQEKIINQTLL